MVKAPLAQESVGKIPQAVEKMGAKRSVLTDEKGLPLAVIFSGANTHDVKLLSDTPDSVIVFRPVPSEESPQNLCMDTGYTGHQDEVEAKGYTAHIRPRGEEKKELETNPIFMLAAGSLKLPIPFSTASESCWFVLKRKPLTISLSSNLLVLSLSGVKLSEFMSNFGIGS